MSVCWMVILLKSELSYSSMLLSEHLKDFIFDTAYLNLYLVGLVDVDDSLGQVADDQNDDNAGEEGSHSAVTPRHIYTYICTYNPLKCFLSSSDFV